MAIRQPDTSPDDIGKRKNKRKLILAGLIALGLLSLFIFLGNPGLWTPEENDEPQAEATPDDETGDGVDDDLTAEPVITNSTDNSMVTYENVTSDDGSGYVTSGSSGSTDGTGYVITYGGHSSGNNNNGGFGGGGGGGGGNGGNDDDSNSNNAPVAQPLSLATDEDSQVAFDMHAIDSDGDSITYTIVIAPTHGSIQSFDSLTGSAIYLPDPDFNGIDVFTFRATDSHGADDMANVTLTIGAIADAPVVSNSTFAVTDEDQPVDIDLDASVSDADADSLITIVNVTQPANGSVTLVNNTATYTPNPNFNGQDQFTFQATDGQLVSNVANVTVTVNPVDDAPVAMNITVSTPEDTPIDILLVNGTSDVDGDVSDLTFTVLPSNGAIGISADNTTVTYTPNQDFEGTDSFEYVISDGISNSTGTVIITVTPVNDAPSIIDGALGAVVVDEDGSTVINIISNVFDPDGDTVTITNVTQPEHGTVTVNPDGTVTYTPDPDYNGQDSFDFTVDDGNGGTATGTVIVTVNPVNDVSVSNDLPASAEEDSTTNIQLNATDADGDLLTFTVVSQPAHGSVVMSDSNLGIAEYTPDLNYNGPDSFSFQASDGTADSGIATVSITVNPVNDDPVANDDNYVTAEDTPIDLEVLADDSDIDGDSLMVEEIVSGPSHGSTSINPDGSVSYEPELNFNGTDSFDYRVSDGNGGSDTATVMISIGAINDAPQADDGSASVDEDSSIDILLNATDADSDPVQSMIISMPSHGLLEVIMPDGSMVRYTPSADYNGNDEFTFQSTDGLEDSNLATVSITVNPVNDSPMTNDDNIMGQEDTTFGGSVLANDGDIDGDSLAVVNTTAPSNGVVNMNPDGTFSYTPNADYNGMDSFGYIVSDGNGGFAAGNVGITVTQANDAPGAEDDYAYTTLSQPVLVKVLDNDSDVDSLSLNVGSVGTPSHGTVTIKPDGKGVIYTPQTGFHGLDQFTYSVTDGSLSDTATVTVKVYNIKFGHLQPPVGGSGNHEFEQGNTASVRLDLKDASNHDIVDAKVLLFVQQLDADNMPVGPVMNATSAGGSNEGNVFDYSSSWYQYNLKTDSMTVGKWALYVYMIDETTDPATWVLLEDQPIDGISTTILIK